MQLSSKILIDIYRIESVIGWEIFIKESLIWRLVYQIDVSKGYEVILILESIETILYESGSKH